MRIPKVRSKASAVSVVLDAKEMRAPFGDDVADGLHLSPVRQTRYDLVPSP